MSITPNPPNEPSEAEIARIVALGPKLREKIMTPTSVDIGTLVTRTPGLHGGSPHIAGKGITVRRIVTWYKRGLNAEEISDRIGNVTLAEVYAALTDYHANKTAIEIDLAMQAAEAKRLEALHSGIPQTNHE
ncbi:MAG: DUF433 domain-containing protein [Leptolyngbyaceae cyanobacterium]